MWGTLKMISFQVAVIEISVNITILDRISPAWTIKVHQSTSLPMLEQDGNI